MSFNVFTVHLVLTIFTLSQGTSGFPFTQDSNESFQRNRKDTAISKIETGGIYKIENEGTAGYLTARIGHRTPGTVVTKKWSSHPNQLWEITKLDQGYLLKPLINEFNTVTSQIDHHAHAYNVYSLKNLQNGKWQIFHLVSSTCISSSGSKKEVKNAKCNTSDKWQRWKFYIVK